MQLTLGFLDYMVRTSYKVLPEKDFIDHDQVVLESFRLLPDEELLDTGSPDSSLPCETYGKCNVF